MWVEAKRIKKGLYLYLRYREGGRTRSVYLGKAGLGWQQGQSVRVARPQGPVREAVQQLVLAFRGSEPTPEHIRDWQQ